MSDNGKCFEKNHIGGERDGQGRLCYEVQARKAPGRRCLRRDEGGKEASTVAIWEQKVSYRLRQKSISLMAATS